MIAMAGKLISIEHVNEQYLQYEDQRSCKNWIRSKGISIIKLGKKHFVKAVEFNAVLNKISNCDKESKTINDNPVKHQLADLEKNIYKELMKKINEL